MVVSTLNKIMPGVMDRLVRRTSSQAPTVATPSTAATRSTSRATGRRSAATIRALVRPSLYTKAKIKMNPMITGVAALGAGLLAVTVWRSRRD